MINKDEMYTSSIQILDKRLEMINISLETIFKVFSNINLIKINMEIQNELYNTEINNIDILFNNGKITKEDWVNYRTELKDAHIKTLKSTMDSVNTISTFINNSDKKE